MSELTTKLKSKFHDMHIRLLDVTSPVFSFIARYIFRKFWISKESKRIYQELMSVKIRKEYLRNKWFELHQPEDCWQAILLSVLIIFIPLIIVSIIFKIIVPTSSINALLSTNNFAFLGSAWQILASVLGITFIIIIFLAELSTKGRYERMAIPVFFGETWLTFTASFGLLSIISIGIFSYLFINFKFNFYYLLIAFYYQIFLLIINLILILRIFIKTITIFPQSFRLFRSNSYLHRIVSNSIQAEIIDRISQNYSQSIISELELEFSYFPPDYPIEHDKVELNFENFSTYYIVDINYKILEFAVHNAKKIKTEYQKEDFKFFARIGRSIARENPGIALINPFINYPSVSQYLKNSIIIREDYKQKPLLDKEFTNNRNMLLNALVNKELDSVSELLELHIDLIVIFMEIFHSYNTELHQNPMTMNYKIFSDWKLVDTITDQYRSLIRHFLEFNDFEIIRKFMNLPIAVMGKALIYKDYFIYQKFLSLTLSLYNHINFTENNKIKKSAKDYLLIRLREHRLYYLNPRLKNAKNDLSLIIEYKSFYSNLLINLNNLIKKSIDFSSFQDYSIFTTEANKLIKSFLEDLDESDIELLQIRLRVSTNKEEKQDVIRILEEKQNLLSEKKELTNLFNVIIMGLSSWILYLYENNRIDRIEIIDFQSINNQFISNIDLLFDIYLYQIPNTNFSDLLNWDSWEMGESTDLYNEVSSNFLHFNELIDRFFVIRSVEFLSKNRNIKIKFPTTESVNYILDKTTKICDDLKNRDLLIDYFNQVGVINLEEVILEFQGMIKDAKDLYDSRVEQEIIDSSLDEELTIKISEEVKNTWKRVSVIRSLAVKFGSLQNIENAKINEQQYINHQLFYRKEAFIKQNRITYLGTGEFLGKELAKIEDSSLYLQIFSSCYTIDIESKKIEDMLSKNLFEMVKDGFSPIIFISGRKKLRIFESFSNFIPSWQVQNNPLGDIRIWGLIEKYPVMQLHLLPQNHICLLDINEIGILRQYLLDGNEPIQIIISEITEADAEIIVDRNPKEVRDSETGQILSKEEKIKQLLLAVNVEMFEAIRFEEINTNAARIIIINDVNKNNV